MDTQPIAIQKKPVNAILITGILIASILPLAISIAIGNLNISYYDKLFYSRFIYWASVLLMFFYALKAERQPLLIWKEENPGLGFFLLSILVLYLLSIASGIVAAIPALFGQREKYEMIKLITKVLKGHPVLIVFIALTAGVTEEIIVRGYILTRLLQLFKGPVIPVIVSSLLFSILHYRYNSLRELIFAFLIGVVFSVYYIKYRNIKALIATHFLIDLISLTLAQHFKLK